MGEGSGFRTPWTFPLSQFWKGNVLPWIFLYNPVLFLAFVVAASAVIIWKLATTPPLVTPYEGPPVTGAATLPEDNSSALLAVWGLTVANVGWHGTADGHPIWLYHLDNGRHLVGEQMNLYLCDNAGVHLSTVKIDDVDTFRRAQIDAGDF